MHVSSEAIAAPFLYHCHSSAACKPRAFLYLHTKKALMPNTPLIRFENVSFQYRSEGEDASKPLLDKVSFEVEAGEFVVLLGNNGSGKSTIANLVDALVLPDEGCVKIAGFDTAQPQDLFEVRRRVGYVLQNPDDQIVATLVRDDVAFGPAGLGVSREEVWHRVEEALDRVGMTELAAADVNTLSGGQKQRVAIAGALALKPELLLLDEPTAMLDEQGRNALLELIDELTNEGVGVLMITHDVVAARHADRALLLAEGSVQPCADVSVLDEPLVRARSAVRPLISALRPLKAGQKPSATEAPSSSHTSGRLNEPASSPRMKDADLPLPSSLITLHDASFSYIEPPQKKHCNEDERLWALRNITLEIREGELLALTGANGSGKSTLIRLLNGLLVPTSGVVRVFGEETSPKHGRNHARRHVGVCLQYPEKQFFATTVLEDVMAGPLNQGLSRLEAEERAQEALEAVGLAADRISARSPFSLSGGEQRRAAIAGFLAMQPDVLVLDEPCANLDAPTHAGMLELIAQLAANRTTVVFASHESADVAALATRIVTLDAGCITRIDTDPS